MTHARVVGAGLSGLAAAWCLTDAGCQVEVIEAAAEPGGLLGSFRAPEGLVERAANGFLWTDTTALWFERLGLTPRFPQASSRKRFIFRDGRPHRWPLTTSETASMAARAGAAWARGRMKPADESVDTWSHRVLGDAAATWLVSPALQGIYAAPPAELWAPVVVRRGERRSSARRKQGSTASLANGMGELVTRLAAALDARGVRFTFNTPVTALDPSIPTVVATNVRTARDLVAPHASALAEALARVEMNTVVSVTAFFEPHAADLHGFGMLYPRGTGVRALGTLFNADIFEGRSSLRSETWIYGSTSAAAPTPSPADASSAVCEDRRHVTGRDAAPIAAYVTKRAPGLPVYGPAIADVERRLADLPPWLALAGNYLGRIGVARLLEISQDAADRLTAGASSRVSASSR